MREQSLDRHEQAHVERLKEFARFHRLPRNLRTQIRSYVDFAFAVTKGIKDGVMLTPQELATLERQTKEEIDAAFDAATTADALPHATASFNFTQTPNRNLYA